MKFLLITILFAAPCLAIQTDANSTPSHQEEADEPSGDRYYNFFKDFSTEELLHTEDVVRSLRRDRLSQAEAPAGYNAMYLFEHWQDWLSLLVLFLTVADYYCSEWLSGTCKRMNGYKALRVDPDSATTPAHDEETGRRKKDDDARWRERGSWCCGARPSERAWVGGVGLAKPKKRRRGKKSPVAETKVPRKPGAPDGVNIYDVVKIWAVCAMIVDHYGYFGLPGISYETARWTRVVGRTAAPVFFFLSGFSTNHRFRWRTWCYGLFLFLCNTWLRLGLTYTSWESLITILFINWALPYFPLHRVRSWIIHGALLAALVYSKGYCSSTLRFAYGSLPYSIGLSGYLSKHRHPLAKLWVLGSMIHYMVIAVDVFSNGTYMTVWIVGLLSIITLVFMFFEQLSTLGEFACFGRLGPFKQLLLYFSRNALLVYIVHLLLFRLIQLVKWSWE